MDMDKFVVGTFEFANRLERIRKAAPVWPEVRCEVEGTEYTLSTRVPFVYNGVKFTRICSESYDFGFCRKGSDYKKAVLDRLTSVAEKVPTQAVPCPYDFVVGPEK